jgi:hypothetical protein
MAITNFIIIKFSKSVGDIPENAVGLIVAPIGKPLDFSRVFILWSYVNLDKSIIPCYDMIQDKSYWKKISEDELTKSELRELKDFSEELERRRKLFIHSSGILVNIFA